MACDAVPALLSTLAQPPSVQSPAGRSRMLEEVISARAVVPLKTQDIYFFRNSSVQRSDSGKTSRCQLDRSTCRHASALIDTALPHGGGMKPAKLPCQLWKAVGMLTDRIFFSRSTWQNRSSFASAGVN